MKNGKRKMKISIINFPFSVFHLIYFLFIELAPEEFCLTLFGSPV